MLHCLMFGPEKQRWTSSKSGFEIVAGGKENGRNIVVSSSVKLMFGFGLKVESKGREIR